MSQKTTQKQKPTTADPVTEDKNKSDNPPSWSELVGRSSSVGIKKSVAGYLVASAAVFLGLMMFAPISVGFTASLVLFTVLSGIVGKADSVGAGIAGAIGGSISSIISAGFGALALTPVITGGGVGLVAGVMGVLIGGLIRKKITS